MAWRQRPARRREHDLDGRYVFGGIAVALVLPICKIDPIYWSIPPTGWWAIAYAILMTSAFNYAAQATERTAAPLATREGHTRTLPQAARRSHPPAARGAGVGEQALVADARHRVLSAAGECPWHTGRNPRGLVRGGAGVRLT